MRTNDEYDRLGRSGETVVREWLRRRGWYVIPTHAIEDGGAPRLIGQIRNFVLPDFQAAKRGVLQWVEVKTKTVSPYYMKAKEQRQGIDLPHWRDYLRVEEETGVAGSLAFVVLCTDSEGTVFAPHLLLASFRSLIHSVQVFETPKPAAKHGMAYFSVDLFGRFEIPQADTPMLKPIPRRIMHPWERKRHLGPQQFRLDSEGW